MSTSSKAVFRFGLNLRLLGLLAAAILPAMVALLYVQIDLRHERVTRVAEAALHQAELLAADMETLIDGARQLTSAIAEAQSAGALTPACGGPLSALRRSLDGYALLAVLGPEGQPVCLAWTGNSIFAAANWAADIATARRSGRFAVGHFTDLHNGDAVLPMFLPFTAADGQHATVVAALDLNWLQRHLARFHTPGRNNVNISDNAGTVLARLPDPLLWRGHRVADGALPLINATAPGTRDLVGLDHVKRRVGYVPAPVTGGVYIAYGVYLPDLLVDIDRASDRGYLLIVVGAVLSLLLMLVITRRLVHAPTEALLGAASRWTSGDLAARAQLKSAEHTEFGRLAVAFNMMAESLQARQHQLQDLNVSLEARVAERTEALSQTNNRLLVEISERERTDAALRQSQKLRAVGHLAGGMAHEFNNLLTTVLGALELLRAKLGPNSPLLRFISHAQDAAQRGGRLTGQLLAFSRNRRLVTATVDLNAVVQAMRELLASTLGRGITLRLALATDLWPALGDRHEIEAAILNLALNARDAMRQGGTLTVTTANGALPADEPGCDGRDGIELAVHDDGVGMTEDELSRAVDPFFTTKQVGEGAGLGLSQVHALTQQLGGALRIWSAPGRGTVVRLFLPRALAGRDETTLVGPCAARRALLLVDDDDQVRQIAADMLTEIGYEVTQAAGGPEALAVLEQDDHPITTLVADYAMPGMTGADLIRRARDARPDIVTLLITGYMEFNAYDAGLLDARHVLRKPFTLRDLASRLDELSATSAAVA